MLTFKQLIDIFQKLEKEEIGSFALAPFSEFNEDGSTDTCIRRIPLIHVYDPKFGGYYYGPAFDMEIESRFLNKLINIFIRNYDFGDCDFSIRGHIISDIEDEFNGLFSSISRVLHPVTNKYIYRIRGLNFEHGTDYKPDESLYSDELFQLGFISSYPSSPKIIKDSGSCNGWWSDIVNDEYYENNELYQDEEEDEEDEWGEGGYRGYGSLLDE